MAVTKGSDKSGNGNQENSAEGSAAKKTESKKESKNTESKEEMVPLSMVQKLVDESIKSYQEKNPNGGNAELVKMLADAIKDGNSKKIEKFDKTAYRDPEPGDMLEYPVVFWSQGLNFVIGDDKDPVGRPIPAPLGVIVFKPNSAKKIFKGKEANMLILCKHMCQSKKELEFLRNHSVFNIRIFEKATSAETIDTRYASLIAQYSASLKNTEAYRVVEQARTLGIAITDDVDGMRLQIAQHHAKVEVEKSEEAMKGSIRKEKKEALLLGHK